MHRIRPHHESERPLQQHVHVYERCPALYVAAMTIGFLALALVPAAWAEETKQQRTRIVQICDTQLGFGAAGYEADVASFRQAVRQINEIKPDLVVICGDLVDSPTADAFADFKDVLSEFKVPCYCAPGNHDVGGPLDQKKLAQYRQTIGKDYFTFQHNGYTFIVVNTQLWKSPIEPEASTHDSWFLQALKGAADRSSPIVVIGHHPLFINDADEKEAYFNIPTPRRKELLELFATWRCSHVNRAHTPALRQPASGDPSA